MRAKVTGAIRAAVPWLLISIAAAEQAGDPAALLGEGHQHRKAGNYAQAIAAYERVLRLAPRFASADQEWMARTFLALTHNLAGNRQRSLELNEQNLAFVRQHTPELVDGPMNREVDSIQAIAADHVSLGNLRKASELLKQALALTESGSAGGFNLSQAKLAQTLGIVQLLSGDPIQAEKTLSTSLRAFDATLTRRISAGMPAAGEYDFQVEVIRWLQKALVAQNRTDEALEIAQQGRARAFAALLATRPGGGLVPAPEETLTLDRLRSIAAAQRSTLVEYSVLYRYNPHLPLQFSDFGIPATDVLIWVIDPSGAIVFRQVTLEPPVALAELVLSARESIGARGRGVVIEARPALKVGQKTPLDAQLRRLHEILIQPVVDLLPADPDSRVTFLPQDLLFLVPFAALQDSSGRFVVEQHTLAVAPSIQVLGLTQRQQERLPPIPGSALVVGNPSMPTVDGSVLPSLPGAEQEAMAVAALLDAHLLTGAQATKQSVVARMPEARVIHLATHGLLDDVGGVFSALALAPADGDQGFLTAREILALRLSAELVILSACNTGQGKITGDGVVGLSRSLIAAGASSVISSLWSVPDSPTTFLMGSFFDALKGGFDKSQALRHAMLETMKKHPAPVDWGAFTFTGAAEVSDTLKTAIAQGMGEGDGGASRSAGSAARYRVFPVPEQVQDYGEWPSREGDDIEITFLTTLRIDQIVAFYRDTFEKEGLHEDETLTSQDKSGFSLVFKGSKSGRRLVVQGVELRELGSNQRSVSVRYE